MTDTTTQNENITVSKDEQAVYDRQIRLWGMDAQNKLRNAKVLIIGGTQLGAEVAKTMSLAGVDEMHLVDHRLVDPLDVGCNFLYNGFADNSKLTKWAAGQEFLYNLNRNVKLKIIEEDLLSKPDEELDAYVQQFTLVIVLDESYDRTAKLNEICHKRQIRFIAGAIFGWIGYGFFDFDGHKFMQKVEAPINFAAVDHETANATSSTTVVNLEDEEQFAPTVCSYPTFADSFYSEFPSSKKSLRKLKRSVHSSYFLVKSILRASKEGKFIGDMAKDVEELASIWKEEVAAAHFPLETQIVQPDQFDHLFKPDFAPTAACVGGLIGQEAIKTISEGKNAIRNIFVYSALDGTGACYDFPFQ